MFGFDRGLHETVSGAIMQFLIASEYAGQPDRMRDALAGRAVREPATGGRAAVRTAPAPAPTPTPTAAPNEEREPIAA